MNSGCIYKTQYVPICSTKVIGYYPPLEGNFEHAFLTVIGVAVCTHHMQIAQILKLLPRLQRLTESGTRELAMLQGSSDGRRKKRVYDRRYKPWGFPIWSDSSALLAEHFSHLFSQSFYGFRRKVEKLRMWHKRLQNVAGVCHWHVEGVMLTTRKLDPHVSKFAKFPTSKLGKSWKV